jgi:hypothetical protein
MAKPRANADLPYAPIMPPENSILLQLKGAEVTAGSDAKTVAKPESKPDK